MDDTLGLSKQEFIYFTAQVIACGEWEKLKIERQTAFELLKSFCESVLPEQQAADFFVSRIYHRLQSSLIANKDFDFEEMQNLPPFSEFGMSNLTGLLKLWQEDGAEAFENGFKRVFKKGWRERKPVQEIIKILSGDGKTIETPVRFSTDDVARRVRAEKWFITGSYGRENADWESQVHYTLNQPKTFKMLSQWTIKLAGGETVSVFFDTNRER